MAQRTEPVVSHHRDPELLLIRVGHRLWKWMKQAKGREKTVLLAALEDVWQAKREFRAGRRKKS